MRSARFRLILLPLAVMCIVVSTMVPIEWRAPVGWDGRGNLLDTFNNLLLFAPLGIALHRRHWWVIAGIACALSSTAEVLQMWDVARYPSPYDVVSNVLGAILAALLYRRLRSTEPVVTLPMNSWWLLAASLCAVGILVLWQWPRSSTSLASWNPHSSLLLGHEPTHRHLWSGTLADLTLLQRALTTTEIRELGRGPVDANVRYGAHVIYSDPHLRRLPGDANELPAEVAHRMLSSSIASNAFTVMARITVADLEQQGPVHIVSFSQDAANRNFDLGQDHDRLTFGVRNAVSGANAENHPAETRSVLRPGTAALVVATYDGAIARIYLDGTLVARSSYVARACPGPALDDAVLPLAWSLLGAIGAILTLALTLAVWPRRPSKLPSRFMITSICMVAGILTELLLPHAAGSHEWYRHFSWLGALLVGMAVVPEPDLATIATIPVRAEIQPVSRT